VGTAADDDPAVAAGALVAHPRGLLHDDARGGDGSANEGNDEQDWDNDDVDM